MSGLQGQALSESARNANQHTGISLKKCSMCKTKKKMTDFHLDKKSKDGHVTRCKPCVKEYGRNRYLLNRDDIISNTKEWRLKNKDRYKGILSNWYKKNKTRHRENCILWQENNIEKEKEYQIEYAKNHSAKKVKMAKKWKHDNPEKTKISARKTNHKKRMNPKQKIRDNVGSLMRMSLKNGKGNIAWEKLVDFTFDDFINRFESLFEPGMSFDNHGKWHIDHIIPVSYFDFSSVTDKGFKDCWSLKNLQPLWARDNLKKGNTLPNELLGGIKNG